MTITNRTQSDRELVAAAGTVLSIPKLAPADSFILHAPLELLARAGLLAHVDPGEKQRARARIPWLASKYAAAGDPVETPRAVPTTSVAETAPALLAAIAAGDLETADSLAAHLGAHATAAQLRHLLGESVAPSLAAAAHSSIFFYLLPRADAAATVPLAILRGLVRELTRYPSWRLAWFEAAGRSHPDRPFVDALLAVPMLGIPGSDFIFPIMNQAESSGVAEECLGAAISQPIDVVASRRVLARVAAWSMLQESPLYAPYGWTHCLTMPQAVMGLAGDGIDPRTALAIAATYVVGFRAALGAVRLDPDAQPEPPDTTILSEAIAAGPKPAAATAWHAPASQRSAIATELATRAALHYDAHFVKYTLACLDAAADDPDERRLYLAAAAALAGWWAQEPDDGFFG